MSELPFSIAIADEKLALVHQKLELTTFPDELKKSGWEYGVPLTVVQRLVERWKDGFDWRTQEMQINSELPVHPQHPGGRSWVVEYSLCSQEKRGRVGNSLVVWPGSFLETRKLALLLTTGTTDFPVFHLVALSPPGYGFSQRRGTKGFDLDQYAKVIRQRYFDKANVYSHLIFIEVGRKLMLAFGYTTNTVSEDVA
ncbi:Alpha/Beta hydrolase protein [Mycena capillaripes]|nr:Alpha/Beta hydrolase protein [Mycena capillaripes]